MCRYFFLFLFSFSFLYGKPTGKRVKSGRVDSFQKGDHLTLVQKGKKAIVEWDSFSIGKNEKVTFSQPDKNAAVLNRVMGKGASKIFGSIEANGKVYLLNKNGIFIGKSGVINTASFIASTLDLADEAFQKDKELRFLGESEASIKNCGKIFAESDVYLFAKQIENEGTIASEKGTVGFGAGQIYLQEGGEQRIYVCPDSEGSILNEGSIEAACIELKAQGGNLYSLAINHTGMIDANTITSENGRVILHAGNGKVSISGTIKNSGNTHLLGDEVRVKEGSLIDASSNHNAGTVLVGGDYQGKNPLIPNAKITVVEPGAVILANGIETGDGGKVIVWADDLISCYGEIRATGGDLSGDGGFIEISSPKSWHASIKNVSAGAPNGKRGHLLLDPVDINITMMSPSSDGYTPPADTFIPTTNPANLWVDDVMTTLATNDLTIETTAGAGATGIVTIEDSFTWGSASVLTILANTSIIVDPAVTVSNTDPTTSVDPVIVFNANTLETTSGLTSVGIDIKGAVTTVGRSISLIGTGGDTGSDNYGVHVDGTGGGTDGTVSTTSGQIVITGASNGPTADNIGCLFDNMASITTDTGNVLITGTGGPGTTGNVGVQIDDSLISSTTTGEIEIIGNGDGTGVNNHGIRLLSAGSVVALDPSSTVINLTGVAGSGTDTNVGIRFEGVTSSIKTDSAEVTLTGTGNGSGISNQGIHFEEGSITSSGTGGLIALVGIGGAGTNDNHGIYIESVSSITSVDASISLNGTANGTGLDNKGVLIDSPTFESTGSGNITIMGAGSSSGTLTNNHGVELNLSNISTAGTGTGNIEITGVSGTGSDCTGVVVFQSLIESTSGNVELTGTGSGSVLSQMGVELSGLAVNSIETTSGDITVTGTASRTSTFSSPGISVLITGVETDTGTITFTGVGGGQDSMMGVDNYGIFLNAGFFLSNGAADSINLMGTGGGGTTGSLGVSLNVGSAISSLDADIFINGGSEGTGNVNAGVEINASNVVSKGLGRIQITGVGPISGVNSNVGIVIHDSSSKITSDSGAIDLMGTGNGTGGFNIGILILDDSLVSSIAGTITIDGVGSVLGASSNHGIVVDDTSIISTSDIAANITLTGIASGSGSEDIILSGSASVGNAATVAPILFNANTVDFGGAPVNIETTNTVSIIPRTPTASIGLGTGSTGTLNLHNFELGTINTSASEIIIGSFLLGDGSVDMNGAFTYLSPLTVNARNITVTGPVMSAGADDIIFNIGRVQAGTFTLNDLVTPGGTFTVNGLTGNDIFDITILGQTATLNGGMGTNTLIGPSAGADWDITGADDGMLYTTIDFFDMQNLIGRSGVDTFNMIGTASITGTIDGGVGGINTLDYSAFTGPVTVNLATTSANNVANFININKFVGSADPSDILIGPNTDNTWTITAVDDGTVGAIVFESFENITGGSASDIFDFTSGAGSITGSVNGGAGNNTILSPPSANTWVIDGANSGNLLPVVTSFTNIQNLTGNTMDDIFEFKVGGSISGVIDGGSFVIMNTFDYSALSTPVSVDLTDMTATGAGTFLNINDFIGGSSGNDTIKGPNEDNVWTTSALNKGTIANLSGPQSFSSFENITGSAQDDEFHINTGGVSGTLDGGFGGTNTLDYSLFGSLTDVNFATGEAPNLGFFTNINYVIGNSSTALMNELTGPLASSTWKFTGALDGTITNSVEIVFEDFFHMVGGSQKDTFDLRSQVFTGTLDGGPGSNRVFGPNVPNTWSVTTDNKGEVAGTPFKNIQNLLGGTNTDNFVFSDGVSLSGNVDGGGPDGINTLDYTAFTTPVKVVFFTETSGIASNLGDGFQNIQSVIGNADITVLPIRSLVTNLQLSLVQIRRFDYFDQFIPIRYVNYYSTVNEVLTIGRVWPYITQIHYEEAL